MTAALAPDVQRPRPDLLVGGWPTRALRLSAAGVAALDALLGGTTADGTPALSRRLVDAGMLLPPPGPAAMDDLTVVVPAKATSEQVERVRAAVPPGIPVLVVDDGSDPPLTGPVAVRHERSRGPGAARNAGAALAATRLVGFVDVDVELPPDGWARLTGHLAHPGVVAAAPRVVARGGRGLGAALEEAVPTLDMGEAAGWVAPRRALSYVPSAALVVDRRAFEAVGGFDPALDVGEDVDLVWRLARTGAVRYDPEVVAVHQARPLPSALRRRFAYATSAGPLERRHPGMLTHLVLPPQVAAVLAAVVAHPVAGAVVAAAVVARAPRRMPALPPATARALTVGALRAGALSAGRFVVRPGLPLLALASLGPHGRRTAARLAVAYGWSTVVRVRGPSPHPAWSRLVASLLDDLVGAAGWWAGCAHARVWRPLLPSRPARPPA